MNKKDNTIVIYFDALLKNNENENIKNSELKAKKGIREFLETIHEFYPNIYLYSDRDSKVAEKILKDNNAIEFISSIDNVKHRSDIYIEKFTVKFNDTSEAAVKFSSVLEKTVDFLNQE